MRKRGASLLIAAVLFIATAYYASAQTGITVFQVSQQAWNALNALVASLQTQINNINTILGFNTDFYAASYPGVDDCAKTQAAWNAAQARGGGIVHGPGVPGETATCTTGISVTQDSQAPVHYIQYETFKWTTAISPAPFVINSTTGGQYGGPSDVIECATKPPTYNIAPGGVIDGEAVVSGFDYEPSAAAGNLLQFGTGIGSNLVNVTVKDCSFTGNANVQNFLWCNASNCVSFHFLDNSGWAVSQASKPTGAFIGMTGYANGAYNRPEIRRNFSQDISGGLLNWNAAGSGAVGGELDTNFCYSVTGSCFNVNRANNWFVHGNVAYFTTLNTGQGAYQFSNSQYVNLHNNHVDSIINGVGATATSQLQLTADIGFNISRNSWNGDTVPGDTVTNFPIYGIDVEGSTQIEIADNCANTQKECVHNYESQIHYHDATSDYTYTSAAGQNSGGFYTLEPEIRGRSLVADYENAVPATSFGGFFERGGYGFFDGASTYVVTTSRHPFSSGSMSFEESFSTTTTAGGLLMWIAPSTDINYFPGLGQVGVLMDNLGKLTFRYHGAPSQIVTAGTYNDGACHRLVVTLDAVAGAIMYVDGASVGTNATLPLYTSNGYWTVGGGITSALGFPPSYAPYWSGQIDTFAEWDSVLTPGEVAGIAQACPETTVPVGAGTIADLNPVFYHSYDADALSKTAMGQGQFGLLSASTDTGVGTNAQISKYTITANGGATPTLTAGCEGAGSSLTGTDNRGTITTQNAAATACTVTFAHTWSAAPKCLVQVIGAATPTAYVDAPPSTGSFVIDFASSTNLVIGYECF